MTESQVFDVIIINILCICQKDSGGGGGCNPKRRKKPKKTSPKFEICGSVRFFSIFFGVFFNIFPFFCGTFSVFSV